jgi:cytochrome d ubiquinol oxidase subunit I
MNSNLSDPAFWSRFQFGFTLTYHYLFPQLTMGLAWFLVYLEMACSEDRG